MEILAACKALRRTELPQGLPVGQAVATTAGGLPARWVIHTVGPVYSRSQDRSALLASCYRESLDCAEKLGATSVAFPLISAGAYRWPVDDAARIAVTTSAGWLAEGKRDMEVLLVAFSPGTEQSLRVAWCSYRSRH